MLIPLIFGGIGSVRPVPRGGTGGAAAAGGRVAALLADWMTGPGRDEGRPTPIGRPSQTELRVALDEGRLDLHGYDERLQRAYAAKTYGELQALLSDLPGAGAGARRAPPRRPGRR